MCDFAPGLIDTLFTRFYYDLACNADYQTLSDHYFQPEQTPVSR
jgi:hypothetical protein